MMDLNTGAWGHALRWIVSKHLGGCGGNRNSNQVNSARAIVIAMRAKIVAAYGILMAGLRTQKEDHKNPSCSASSARGAASFDVRSETMSGDEGLASRARVIHNRRFSARVIAT